MEGQISSLFRSRFARLPGKLKSSSTGPSHIPLHNELPSRSQEHSHIQADRPQSASRRLPQELILQILGHLVPSVHTAAYQLPLDSSNFTESLASSAAREVERSQRYLHWSSQVCRDWHAVASELLYASPFLTTTRRMELFIRTLTEVPSLRRFVKDVYAPLSNQGTAANLFGWIFGRRSNKTQREELVALLSRCQSIEALTIRHSVKKSLASITPIDDIVRSAAIDDKLKRLTIHGSSFEARWHPQFSIMPILTGLMLPNLEVLCLRGIYILPTFQLPSLPNLRTLQLVENYYFPSAGPRRPLFTQETLPKLRTVEIFRNHFAEATYGPVFDKSCFSQLECLHFIEDERCLEVTRWADSDSQVRHLALGFLHARDHVDFVCWRFPDALESLTLLLREREVPEDEAALGRDNSLEILDAVLHCLELNLQEATAFKTLSVLAKFPGARDTSQRLARDRTVDDIRQLCQSKGVEFNYSLDAPDGWVAERLTRTHTHASMD